MLTHFKNIHTLYKRDNEFHLVVQHLELVALKSWVFVVVPEPIPHQIYDPQADSLLQLIVIVIIINIWPTHWKMKSRALIASATSWLFGAN